MYLQTFKLHNKYLLLLKNPKVLYFMTFGFFSFSSSEAYDTLRTIDSIMPISSI